MKPDELNSTRNVSRQVASNLSRVVTEQFLVDTDYFGHKESEPGLSIAFICQNSASHLYYIFNVLLP